MTGLEGLSPEDREAARSYYAGLVASMRSAGIEPDPEWVVLAGEVRAEAPQPISQGNRRVQRGTEAVPALTIRRYSDIQRERLDWLWRGYIPLGKLTILDGDPKLGKSTLMLDVAARMSRGAAMPPAESGMGGVPADVLILSAEDDAGDTIGPRLDAAGADSSRVHEVRVDGLLQFPDHIDLLREAISQTGARLVIIDPFVAFVNGRLSVNSDQEVRRALVPLAALADETGAAIVLVRHLRKAGGSAIQRGGGSIGIAGQARSVLAVARDPYDPERRLLTVTGGNVGPESESPTLAFRVTTWSGRLPDGEGYEAGRLEWEPDPVDLTAEDLLSEDDGRARLPVKPRERPHEKAGRALREVLTESGPLPAKEALARLQVRGYSYDLTGSRAQGLKREAGITSQRVQGPDGPYYLWMVTDDE